MRYCPISINKKRKGRSYKKKTAEPGAIKTKWLGQGKGGSRTKIAFQIVVKGRTLGEHRSLLTD